MTPNESLEDWYSRNKPSAWQDWEWNKFLCSIGRIYLETASQQMALPLPVLIKYLETAPTAKDKFSS
jgi:hypothetical protein